MTSIVILDFLKIEDLVSAQAGSFGEVILQPAVLVPKHLQASDIPDHLRKDSAITA